MCGPVNKCIVESREQGITKRSAVKCIKLQYVVKYLMPIAPLGALVVLGEANL